MPKTCQYPTIQANSNYLKHVKTLLNQAKQLQTYYAGPTQNPVPVEGVPVRPRPPVSQKQQILIDLLFFVFRKLLAFNK
jgi:hypothetical protein